MDSDTTKSDAYLLMMLSLNMLRLVLEVVKYKRQLKNGTITSANLETSSPVTILILLDRYVSELLQNFKKRYSRK